MRGGAARLVARGRALGLALGLALATGGCMHFELTRWQRGAGACPGEAAAVPWPRLDPVSAGMDPAALEALAARVDRGELGRIHSLLVVRDGALVFERYFRGEDALWGRPLGEVDFGPDVLHDQRSVTKSVVGALVGIALGEGLLPDLDAEIVDLLPGRESQREHLAGLRLRDALTMSAGLAWDEETHPYWDPRNDEHAMSLSRDPVGWVLSRDRVAKPGSEFRYNGGLPSVLAAVVAEAAGRPIDRFAVERLWCPLGVERVEWLRHPSGLHLAASGLRLRPRDMARFGQLLLDAGRFGDRQLLPADYARASLEPQVATSWPDTPAYGYQWWLAPLPDAPEAWMPVAVGNGGQRIALHRGARLVVVVTAGAYDAPDQGRAPSEAIRAVIAALRR